MKDQFLIMDSKSSVKKSESVLILNLIHYGLIGVKKKKT